MAEAGYPNGFETTLSFDLGFAGVNEPLCVLTQESLAQIGIKCTINKIPGATWRTELNKKVLPLYTNVFSGWLDYPEYFFIWCYHGKNSIFNTMSYQSKELDGYIDGAVTAAAEGDKADYDKDVKSFRRSRLRRHSAHPALPALRQRRDAEERVRLSVLVPPPARLPRAGEGVSACAACPAKAGRGRLPGAPQSMTVPASSGHAHRRRREAGPSRGLPCCCMILKRLMMAVPSLIGVVIVTFLLTRALPGDPAAYFAGPAATKEAIEQIRVQLGLDKPLYVQFVRYVGDLAHGDLGNSLTTGQPVGHEIKTRLPASAELTLLGLIVSMLIAVPLGIMAATRPNSIIDHACRVISTAGVSLPVFFTGLILVYVFYYLLGWAPAPLGRLDVFFSPPPHVTGFYLIDSADRRQWRGLLSSLKQLTLPALTLGIFSLAPIARMTRASMLAVLASDFVRTARASGLTPYTVVVTYAFRNAMLPVITTLGMVFSFLLGANVLVEKVFAWPGIGSFAVEALIASDFAPLQGFVLTMAVMYVALNLVIDILYGVIDPRVRIEA